MESFDADKIRKFLQFGQTLFSKKVKFDRWHLVENQLAFIQQPENISFRGPVYIRMRSLYNIYKKHTLISIPFSIYGDSLIWKLYRDHMLRLKKGLLTGFTKPELDSIGFCDLFCPFDIPPPIHKHALCYIQATVPPSYNHQTMRYFRDEFQDVSLDQSDLFPMEMSYVTVHNIYFSRSLQIKSEPLRHVLNEFSYAIILDAYMNPKSIRNWFMLSDGLSNYTKHKEGFCQTFVYHYVSVLNQIYRQTNVPLVGNNIPYCEKELLSELERYVDDTSDTFPTIPIVLLPCYDLEYRKKHIYKKALDKYLSELGFDKPLFIVKSPGPLELEGSKSNMTSAGLEYFRTFENKQTFTTEYIDFDEWEEYPETSCILIHGTDFFEK